MIHFNRITFLIIIIALFTVAFSQNVQNRSESIEEIQTLLESGQSIEKTEPFVERNFIPFTKDNPIKKAVAYGCYRKGQIPWGEGPSKEEIFEDLTIIS